MNYDQKLASLRARKLRQTREKIEREGVLDEDDYGRIVPPEGLWKIRPNHPDGSFYGFDAWTDNFCSLMAVHPVYVDPDDAFAGRWMYFMSKMRPNKWNPAYPYDHLKATSSAESATTPISHPITGWGSNWAGAACWRRSPPAGS